MDALIKTTTHLSYIITLN